MKKVAEYIFIFIAIQFISLTLANGAVLLTGGQIENNMSEIAVAMSIATFILVIFVFIVWLHTITFSSEYIKTKPYFQLLLCTILGLATISPSVFLQNIMSDLTNTNEELFKSMIYNPLGFVALALLGPVSEEIVFRGAILKQLFISVSGNFKVIIISALLFAIIHFNPAQFFHAFIIGILLGWVCLKTRSIVPCILIHTINNGIAFVIIKYYPEVTLNSFPIVITSLLLIIVSLLGLVKTRTIQ